MTDTHLMRCSLCRRPTPPEHLSKHHLLPKSRGGRETEPVCRTCHGQVHATFSLKELEAEYDTLDKLRSAPELQRYLRWIARQPPTRQFRRLGPARGRRRR